jgi:hypothetical protein
MEATSHALCGGGSVSCLAYGLTEETGDAKGHRQVVQFYQGLRLH